MIAGKLPTPQPLLETLTVGDAMSPEIVACAPSAGLRDVARALAEHEIHCVVVSDLEGPDSDRRDVWGIISDLDLMRALGSPVTLSAGNLAALEIVTVGPGDSLARAAQLMAEHDTAHLVVVVDGRPTGVLSTLDVAGAIAQYGTPSPAG